MDDTLWYFAFGANMASQVFVRRRGMRPRTTEAARLADHRLVFTEPGIPWLEPAFASVEPAAGSTVHGALYRLSRSDFERLTRDESDGYEAREAVVCGDRAGFVRARLYVARRPVAGLWPSRRYLDLLLDGAREVGLPESYVREISLQPTHYVPLLTPAVGALIGVYDRLRRVGFRHERITAALRGEGGRACSR